jgi:hypothetical protein
MTARLPLRTIAVTAIGGIGILVGYVLDPARTAAAYLVAYGACAAVVLAALAMVMVARVTAATWFVALRRQAEQVTATLPALALLVIPVLLSRRLLYPWAGDPGALAPDIRATVLAKGAYLNVPFFVVRTVLYVAIWVVIAEVLRRASLAQDHGDTSRLDRRMYAGSSAGLIALAITMSFASFDWFMSLAPAWYSTIYGVDYFAGGMVAALSLITLLVVRGRRRGELPAEVGSNHLHALAKLLLTFLLFWVYIGFSQLIVIWSAEIPAERGWYALRMRGGWETLGGVLVVGHFALPFCALLVRAIKRSTFAMASIGCWLLLMHYLDVYWIVMPDAPFHGGWGFVADAATLLFIGGTVCTTWALRRVGETAVPASDRRLAASLQYATD